MIGALISLLSLELSRRLVAASVVAKVLTLTDASNATPIVVETATPHQLVRSVHGVVSGIVGNDDANGVWVLTPTDSTHLALSSFDRDGTPLTSTGSGNYVSGGTVQIAFPDGQILLGRRNVAMQTMVATPRIVFVPMSSPAWDLQPYGGVIPALSSLPRSRAQETSEQQRMLQSRQLATEQHRFEVHVTGCATDIGYSAPSPDFGDFDATQYLYHQLYAVMFDLISPDRARVLGGKWVSQTEDIQTLDVRGQKWVAMVEIRQPVTDQPLSFLPANTVADLLVYPQSGSAEGVLIEIPVS